MSNYKVYQNVELQGKGNVQPYCLLGVPSESSSEGTNKTIVGKDYNIRSHTVIYSGNIIGESFQTGHGVLLREDNEIVNNVSVVSGSDIEYKLEIGNKVRIHSQVFIPEHSILKDGSWVGPRVTFTNAKFPRSRNVKNNLKGPIIESSAKIGANATLLPGVRVKSNSLVGAGSVVTKDVPRGAVVAGNPAEVIGKVKELRRKGSEEELLYDY